MGIGIIDLFGSCDFDLDPMTFIIIRTRTVDRGHAACILELLTSSSQKLGSSERQTYIHTDRQTEPKLYSVSRKKRDQNVFGNSSDKPRAILMKFDTWFPE